MLARARTFTIVGVSAEEVVAEVDVRNGLPSFSVVGLPDAAVRESRERVRAAIENSGFSFPMKRITANLAPADVRKAGPGFDLAIAAALLAASGQIPAEALNEPWVAGELALDGAIRPVPGVLAMAERASRSDGAAVIVPSANAAEAQLATGVCVYGVGSLAELRGLGTDRGLARAPEPERSDHEPRAYGPDLAALRGHAWLRSGLEIAAAGGHSLLLIGPPGAGKSLAIRCLPSLLPDLRGPEAIEVARIAGVCGLHVPAGGPTVRPFRAPHHTISATGLVGGGNPFRPGEVTLAHRGVLFLDELPEFSRSALEAMRGPLEDGQVSVRRARYQLELPCRFMLAAAANPCPCGRGESDSRCSCTPQACARYSSKLSAALADRIDLLIEVAQPSQEELAGAEGEGSPAVRDRVCAARASAESRLGPGRCNADMGPRETRALLLDDRARHALALGHQRLALSARGWERVLRVARTLADLDGRERIGEDEVSRALSFRRPERRAR